MCTINDSFITLTGNTSDLRLKYQEPQILDKSNYTYHIALETFDVFNSIPNVTEENNSIKIKPGKEKEEITISITPGAYEIDQIHSMIVADLTNLGIAKVADNFKFIPMISIKQVFIEIAKGWKISFNVKNSMATLLGFKKTDSFVGPKICKGEKSVMINTVDSLIFKSNIIAPSMYQGTREPILYIHPIDVATGFKLLRRSNRDTSYIPVSTDVLDNIRVWVEDKKGKPIDFRHEDIMVNLKLRSTRKRKLNSIVET